MTANSQRGISGWRLAAEEFRGSPLREVAESSQNGASSRREPLLTGDTAGKGVENGFSAHPQATANDQLASCLSSPSRPAEIYSGRMLENLLDTVARRVEARPRVEAKQEQRRAEIAEELK